MSDAIVLPETGTAEPRRTPTVYSLMTAPPCVRSQIAFRAREHQRGHVRRCRVRAAQFAEIRPTW